MADTGGWFGESKRHAIAARKKSGSWKKSQSRYGYYRKRAGHLPDFIWLERTEYQNNDYVVMHKIGIAGASSPLKYFKTRSQALAFISSYKKKR